MTNETTPEDGPPIALGMAILLAVQGIIWGAIGITVGWVLWGST